MGMAVCAGAGLACSFGAAPSALIVLPVGRVLASGKPQATVMDFAPVTNIPPFGFCSSLANPTVASATAAALGTLTPMPCLPVTAPWIGGSPTVTIGGKPVLNTNSTCRCAYQGVITITQPGQATVQVP